MNMKEFFNTYLWAGQYQRWTLISLIQFVTHIILITIFSKWGEPSWTFYLWGAALVIFTALNLRNIRKKEFDSYFEMISDFPDIKNRVITFHCHTCNVDIKTLAIANGNIPDTLKCDGCGSNTERFNIDKNPNAYPQYEWIRPDWKAYSVMKDKTIKERIINGGLLPKKLNI